MIFQYAVPLLCMPVICFVVMGLFMFFVTFLLGGKNKSVVVATLVKKESLLVDGNTRDFLTFETQQGVRFALRNVTSLYGLKLRKHVVVLNSLLQEGKKYQMTVAGLSLSGQNILEAKLLE